MTRRIASGARLPGGFPHAILALLCGFVGLIDVPPARGHGLHYPKQDFLRIDEQKVTLSVRLDFDDEVGSICDRFDRNGDGTIAEDEREALLRYLVGDARRSIVLLHDGERMNLSVSSKVAQGCDTPGPQAAKLTVDVVLEAPLPAKVGERAFELSDALRNAEDEIPVRIELRGLRFATYSEGRLEKSGAANETLRGIYVRHGEPLRFTLNAVCADCTPALRPTTPWVGEPLR